MQVGQEGPEERLTEPFHLLHIEDGLLARKINRAAAIQEEAKAERLQQHQREGLPLLYPVFYWLSHRFGRR